MDEIIEMLVNSDLTPWQVEEISSAIEKYVSDVEIELYEEYQQRLDDTRRYIIEKVDEYLKLKGPEVYAWYQKREAK